MQKRMHEIETCEGFERCSSCYSYPIPSRVKYSTVNHTLRILIRHLPLQMHPQNPNLPSSSAFANAKCNIKHAATVRAYSYTVSLRTFVSSVDNAYLLSNTLIRSNCTQNQYSDPIQSHSKKKTKKKHTSTVHEVVDTHQRATSASEIRARNALVVPSDFALAEQFFPFRLGWQSSTR